MVLWLDSSLFIFHADGHTVLVLVYVDDILITSSDKSLITTCITHLHDRFALKDLGPLHDFLGVEVASLPSGLHLSQHKYVLDILSRTNMLEAKPCTSPIATGSTLSKHDGVLLRILTYIVALSGLYNMLR